MTREVGTAMSVIDSWSAELCLSMIAGGFKLLFGDTILRFFWILYTANLIFESNSIGVLVWLLREAFEGLML